MQRLVQVEIAVFVITGNRMTFVCQVHADLMRAAGFDGDFKQGKRRAGRRRTGRNGRLELDQRDRAHAVRVVVGHHLDASFAAVGQVLVQRLVDHPVLGWPVATDQRQIHLVGFTLAELLLQQLQRHAAFGNQQNAAGFAVQAVHQLQKVSLGPGHAQLLDHAKAHAAAAMHGHTRRFVDGQQKVVFKKNRKFGGRRITAHGRAGAVAHHLLRGCH